MLCKRHQAIVHFPLPENHKSMETSLSEVSVTLTLERSSVRVAAASAICPRPLFYTRQRLIYCAPVAISKCN